MTVEDDISVPGFVDLTIPENPLLAGELFSVSQRQNGLVDVIVSDIGAMPDAFQIDTSFCSLTDGESRPLALLVPGRETDVRFEIGEAVVFGDTTQLKLFGSAFGSTVHFVF